MWIFVGLGFRSDGQVWLTGVYANNLSKAKKVSLKSYFCKNKCIMLLCWLRMSYFH